jgi:chromate transporter
MPVANLPPSSPDQPPSPELATLPSFGEAFGVWTRIGCLSFGGPAGQIAMMHRVLVDEKKWIDEPRFLHALNYCMLLPGPEAQQLATYVGWLMHGARGGLAAGLMFILPGALVMLALSFLYVGARDVPLVEAALFGIKAAVLVVVVEAILRIGKRALKSSAMVAVAAAAFVGIFFFEIPFPLIVIAAGLLGFWLERGAPRAAEAVLTPARDQSGRWSRAGRSTATWLAIWWAPVAVAALALGPGHVLVAIGVFFSKLAVVSFGGAYALMAYMTQEAVEAQHWLVLPEMVDGLGLAETTPGPLILVTQFVGFLAGHRAAAPFGPYLAATLGAAMATWTVFAPSFLWIFAGAPFIEELRGNRRLAGALTAITAAVTGVVMNLAVWFTLHVLFHRLTETHLGPLRYFAVDVASLDVAAAGLALLAAVLVFRLHRSLIETIAVMAALGIAVRFGIGLT